MELWYIFFEFAWQVKNDTFRFLKISPRDFSRFVSGFFIIWNLCKFCFLNSLEISLWVLLLLLVHSSHPWSFAPLTSTHSQNRNARSHVWVQIGIWVWVRSSTESEVKKEKFDNYFRTNSDAANMKRFTFRHWFCCRTLNTKVKLLLVICFSLGNFRNSTLKLVHISWPVESVTYFVVGNKLSVYR